MAHTFPLPNSRRVELFEAAREARRQFGDTLRYAEMTLAAFSLASVVASLRAWERLRGRISPVARVDWRVR